MATVADLDNTLKRLDATAVDEALDDVRRRAYREDLWERLTGEQRADLLRIILVDIVLDRKHKLLDQVCEATVPGLTYLGMQDAGYLALEPVVSSCPHLCLQTRQTLLTPHVAGPHFHASGLRLSPLPAVCTQHPLAHAHQPLTGASLTNPTCLLHLFACGFGAYCMVASDKMVMCLRYAGGRRDAPGGVGGCSTQLGCNLAHEAGRGRVRLGKRGAGLDIVSRRQGSQPRARCSARCLCR